MPSRWFSSVAGIHLNVEVGEAAVAGVTQQASGGVPQVEEGLGDHGDSVAPSRPGRRTQSQAIGHSRGGLSTKIRALCDALGNLLKFVLVSLKTSWASSRSSNALPCAVNLISVRADPGLRVCSQSACGRALGRFSGPGCVGWLRAGRAACAGFGHVDHAAVYFELFVAVEVGDFDDGNIEGTATSKIGRASCRERV